MQVMQIAIIEVGAKITQLVRRALAIAVHLFLLGALAQSAMAQEPPPLPTPDPDPRICLPEPFSPTTMRLTASQSEVVEGSAITFTLTGTGIDARYEVDYNIEGRGVEFFLPSDQPGIEITENGVRLGVGTDYMPAFCGEVVTDSVSFVVQIADGDTAQGNGFVDVTFRGVTSGGTNFMFTLPQTSIDQNYCCD